MSTTLSLPARRRVARRTGILEAALEHFQPLLEHFLQGNAGDPGRRQNIAVPDAIEALVALGRLGVAEELLAAGR